MNAGECLSVEKDNCADADDQDDGGDEGMKLERNVLMIWISGARKM